MYTKSITPAFEVKGKRRKLTGYLGELRDGETLIHSMEYSTNSQAEQALDTLVFDLLSDNPQATAEPASTCGACGKPHSPQSCPEMRAMLFAPDKPICATCGDEGDCPDCDNIFAPIDVDFVSVGWEA